MHLITTLSACDICKIASFEANLKKKQLKTLHRAISVEHFQRNVMVKLRHKLRDRVEILQNKNVHFS